MHHVLFHELLRLNRHYPNQNLIHPNDKVEIPDGSTGAGENIAAGQQSSEDVMNSWMNSRGHRANILNANYTKLGVGFCTGGRMGTYWVQSFTG